MKALIWKKSWKMNKVIACWLAAVLLLPVSCGVKKEIKETKYMRGRMAVSDIILSREMENSEIQSVKYKRINFTYTNPDRTVGGRGSMGIIRDSLILISVTPITGLEAARLFIYKDSVKILHRMEKNYYRGSWQKFMEKFNMEVGYGKLEALLMGEYFSGMSSMRKYAQQVTGSYRFRLIEEGVHGKYVEGEYTVEENDLNIRKLQYIDPRLKARIDVMYEGYEGGESKVGGLPGKIQMEMSKDGGVSRLKLEMGGLVLNEKIRAEFVVPGGYRVSEL